jgi:hypothetical protein
MGDLAKIGFVPFPEFVTIEELFVLTGITRTMFTGRGPELRSVLCLRLKDSKTCDYYHIADCEPYDNSSRYITGERVIVRFGNLLRDDFYFVRHELGTYYKYEITVRGKKMHLVVSLSHYTRLVAEDREYLESLPKVSI